MIRRIALSGYRWLSYRLTGYCLSRSKSVQRILEWLHCYLRAGGEEGIYDVQGSKMIIPRSDVAIGLRGFSERYVTEYLRKAVRPGMCCVDVGANLGYYTLLLSRLVGDAGRVVAFEPEPTNFSLLVRNVALNRRGNILLVRTAVSDKSGKIELNLSPDNSGGHCLFRVCAGWRSVSVDAVSLDEYFSSSLSEPIHVVKIDVEGAEFLVLKGMTQILKRNRDIKIVMEYSPMILNRLGVIPERPLNFMQSYGFDMYEIGKSTERMPASELLRKYTLDGGRNAMLAFERAAGF